MKIDIVENKSIVATEINIYDEIFQIRKNQISKHGHDRYITVIETVGDRATQCKAENVNVGAKEPDVASKCTGLSSTMTM